VPERITAWLWLGGSLLLAVLWANLSRLVARRLPPWLLQLLRLLYYVGVPFAALLSGAVVEHPLGLPAGLSDKWLDWARDVGWAVALGAGAWVLLALTWWAYRRALATAGEGSTVAGLNASGLVHLREAAYYEVHWFFYRSAPIRTVGTYWGNWIGLALVALEAALNPAWREALADPPKVPAQLMRGALAVTSGVLFLKTENLWLAVAVHWGASWGLAALARALPVLPAREPDRAHA
jgi:hypothetical protein